MSELIDFILAGQAAEGDFVARLTGALLLILVGWLAAVLTRAVLTRSMGALLRLLSARYPSAGVGASRIQKMAVHALPRIVYWFIIVFFLALGSETLGLPIFTAWLAQIMNYIPLLLTAVLLTLAGIWAAIVLKEMVSRMAAAARLPYARVLGGLCQTVVVVVTLVIAVNQLGIDLSFLTIMSGIVLGSLLLSVALAFGLGANTMVGNIISCHYLQRLYRVGNVIEIDGLTGTIVKITGAFVVLETETGQVTVPAKNFAQTVSTLINHPG